MLEAKWVGIDFGQTLCDSSPERTYWMIGDTSKELGEPDLVAIRCQRWRVMKEKYALWSYIKEKHRDEIGSYVFDGREGAQEIFARMEEKYTKLAVGAFDAITYLRSQGIEVSVVAELRRTFGPIGTDQASRFLRAQNVIDYIDELITPLGSVNLRDNTVDLRYKGTSKEEGNLYDVLAEDLAKRGIKTSEAVMVGDKEWSDITPAQKRGFKAIHYVGFIYHAPSNAEFVIRDFSELKNIIRGVRS